jgi:hypothetical protein
MIYISKSENIEPNKFTYLYLFIIKYNNFLRNNVNITHKLAQYMRLFYKFSLEIEFYN